MAISSFSQLALRPELLQRLSDLNLVLPTAVQAISLEPALAGEDLVVKGKTGSGKTLAFTIALLNKLRCDATHVQALVLCPTRELAEQVSVEIKKVAALIANVRVVTLCGGMPIGAQVSALNQGVTLLLARLGV